MANSKGARPILNACKTQFFSRLFKPVVGGVFGATLFLIAGGPQPALAGGTTLQPIAHVAVPKAQSQKGLNLLQRPVAQPRPQTRKVSTLGNGSYICSPAGFGKRSHCFAN